MIHTQYLTSIFDRKKFASKLWATVKELKKRGVEFDAIAVTGNSGTLFGGALAMRMKKHLWLVRKPSDNSHYYPSGDSTDSTNPSLLEGPEGPKTYLFVDDQVSSGQTRNRVVKMIQRKYPDAVCMGIWTYNDLNFKSGPIYAPVLNNWQKTMNHITFGYLPPYRDFEESFYRCCVTDRLYHLHLNTNDGRACNGFKLCTGWYEPLELYQALEEIVAHWEPDTSTEAGPYQDERISLVAAILETLGFEWV